MPIVFPEHLVKAELDAYLSTPKLDPEEDCCSGRPKSWIPNLEQAHEECGTSSPSEHLFSALGNTMVLQRASLKPDKVDMLSCAIQCTYYI